MTARRRHIRQIDDNLLVAVAGELWGPAITRLAGLTIREAARQLRIAGVIVHSPTLDLIVHGRQAKARLDVVRGVATLSGIPAAWLLATGAPTEIFEETVGIRPQPTSSKEWATVGLVRESFLLACLRAARRDHFANKGSEKAWLRLRQPLHGAFLHLVDPDHWCARFRTGKAAALSLPDYAEACVEMRRGWLAILGPWLRGEERLDYGFLWEVSRFRRAREAGPSRFSRGPWVSAWHREP